MTLVSSIPGGYFGLGVLTSCLGCFVATLGVQLRISAFAARSGPMARLREVLGWSLWAAGQGLGQVAIAIAPASVIACITFCGSLLSNALLAPLVLNERLTWAHWLGLLFLAGGGSAVTAASSHQSEAYSLEELELLAQRPPFLSILAVCLGAALPFGMNAFRLQSVGPWSFAYCFGLCGAADLLVTKCTLQVLQLCFEHRRYFEKEGHDPERPPLIVLSVFAATMLTLHMCSLGFWVVSASYGDALQNTPIFLAMGTLLQVVMCGTFFNEFGAFHYERTFCFSCGFASMLIGLVVTSLASASLRDSPEQKQSVQLVEELLASQGQVDLPAPMLSSGILDRQLVARSADLLLLPELQRSTICFNTKTRLRTNLRQVGSEPPWPLSVQPPKPTSGLRQVSTAPGGVTSISQGLHDRLQKELL